jgi:hypothetical protein
VPGYWCYTHNAPRAQCADANGECPEALRLAADTSGPRPLPGLVGMKRLQMEREGGYSQRELARENIEAAKRDGREIESVRGYGHG